MVRMSWPCSSRYLVKEWRKAWQVAVLLIRVSYTAARTARCMRFPVELERSDQCATTWRDLYASGQKLLRQGVDAAEVPGRLGIGVERWLEICGACSVRVVAFEIGEA